MFWLRVPSWRTLQRYHQSHEGYRSANKGMGDDSGQFQMDAAVSRETLVVLSMTRTETSLE